MEVVRSTWSRPIALIRSSRVLGMATRKPQGAYPRFMFALLHKEPNVLSSLNMKKRHDLRSVRVSGRVTIAQRFIAGKNEIREEVRGTDD